MSFYAALADVILIVHALFVAFVVFGLVAIVMGHWLGWAWVRNLRFRIAHLVAIGIVVAQAWAGVLCPLTIWESALRRAAGQSGYAGSFIQHWLHRILFYQAEDWVFTVVYTLFGAAVVASWFVARPSPRGRPH
jgi:hypothetical protein